MATKFYNFYVESNNDGTYTVTSYWGIPYYISEYDDGNGDDLTVIGDIVNEQVDLSGSGAVDTYIFNSNSLSITPISSLTWIYSKVYYANGNILTLDTDAEIAICFSAGTRIETVNGPKPIEELAVGDLAVTASGARRPIVWIGRRVLNCAGERAHMAPIRIRADAFGAGVPERDVFLSPGHPVLVKQDGVEVLVPIMNLINGTTIERTTLSRVTYWHVELDQHDVLLADGLPAESFFDMGSRAWFDNDLDDVLANPDLVPAGQHGRCRDVAIDGPLVEAERRRLADLFYAGLSAQCAWPTAGQYAAL
ncbi:Hint domain-containing protein [Jiella pacifica]|uniref:Hint domain-containing protein n=1 Tax=Jiella pacifica TaxID=2696469 RepID=A0A6N9TC07_9HYPH|nr:Hint domain-containing protein [Jiella pacifica]NDW07209.1 hypothetical protein [Jiella pacifica]